MPHQTEFNQNCTYYQEGEATTEEAKKSNHEQRKIEKRQKDRKLDAHIEEQFSGGHLLACISSRPDQWRSVQYSSGPNLLDDEHEKGKKRMVKSYLSNCREPNNWNAAVELIIVTTSQEDM